MLKTVLASPGTLLLVTMLMAACPASAQVQVMSSTGYNGDPSVIWVPEAGTSGSYLGARTDNAASRGDTKVQNGSANEQVQLWAAVKLENLFLSPGPKVTTDSNYCDGAEAPGLVEFPINGVNYVWLSYRGSGNSFHIVYAPAKNALSAAAWKPMTTDGKLNGSRDWSFIVTTTPNAGNLSPDAADGSGNCVNTSVAGPSAVNTTNGTKLDLWIFHPNQTPSDSATVPTIPVTQNGTTTNMPITAGIYVEHMLDPAHTDPCRPGVLISSGGSSGNLSSFDASNESAFQTAEFRPWEVRHNTGPQGQPATNAGTNEAPQAFLYTPAQNSAQQLYLVYSANSYQYGDYLMGILTFNGALDNLDGYTTVSPQGSSPGATEYQNWVKSNNPFFQATNYPSTGTAAAGTFFPVCNVGSAAVVETNHNVATSGASSLWMVYNGKSNCVSVPFAQLDPPGSNSAPAPPSPSPATGCPVSPSTTYDQSYHGNSSDTVLYSGNGRNIRLQPLPLTFDSSGAPQAVTPVPDTSEFAGPTGETLTPADYVTPASGQILTIPNYLGQASSAGAQFPLDQYTNQIFYAPDFETNSFDNGVLTRSFSAGSSIQIAFYGTSITFYGPFGACTGSICTPANDKCTASTYGKIAITDETKTYLPAVQTSSSNLYDLSSYTGTLDPNNSKQFAITRSFGSTPAQHVLTISIPPIKAAPATGRNPYSVALTGCYTPANDQNTQALPVGPFAIDRVDINNNSQ